jgi:thiazole/oxazole-forming peptide maturase SagD family component
MRLGRCRHVTYRSPLSRDLVGAAVVRDDQVIGAAWDVDGAAARRRAVGEAVERMALEHDVDGFAVYTARELGDRAISLDRAVRFTAEQVTAGPLRRYGWTRDTPTSWIPAVRLAAPGEEVLVPADLVFFRDEHADATLMRPVSSTGTAAHPVRDKAFMRALVECAERHELALAHRHGWVPWRIRVEDHPAAHAVARMLEVADVRLRIGLLPGSLGVPVAVAALVSRDSGRPSIAVGTGSRSTVAAAVLAATLEAVQMFHLAWQLLHRGNTPPVTPADPHQRAVWWGTRPAELVEELFGDDAPPGLGTTGQGSGVVDHVCARLAEQGHPGAVLELGAPPGYHVVRVVLPSLLLPYTDERHPYLSADGVPPPRASALPHPYI